MKNYLLRITLILAIILPLAQPVMADTPETFVIMRKKSPYTADTWSYSGTSNSLQTSKIKEWWDDGKRLTCAAYGGNGWFIAASKNTGYTMQTYHYDSTWPKDWINNKYEDGYFITSIAHGDGKWFIVMSQGTNFLSQVYFLRDENTIGDQIKKYWDNDYRITQICPYNGKWFVVMTQGSPYGMQTYGFRSTVADAKSLIKSKWDEDYNITNWMSNGYGSKYFVVLSKFSDGTSPAETYITGTTPSDNISKYWKEDYTLVYIGGGRPSTSSTACTGCSGAGAIRCAGCYGTGFVAYIGMCRVCGGTGRTSCFSCAGKGSFTRSNIAAMPNERYVTPGKSNFSEGGVPNLIAKFSKYVIGDNWRKDSEGKSQYWSGESTLNVDIANLKTTVTVAGKTYSFKLNRIGANSPFDFMHSFTLYTSRDKDVEDEEIQVIFWDNNENMNNKQEYCLIKSKSRGIDITLNTFQNGATVRNFFTKLKAYLDKNK